MDRVGRVHQKLGLSDEEIAANVSLGALDERFVEQATHGDCLYGHRSIRKHGPRLGAARDA
jgi:hypothetical protein